LDIRKTSDSDINSVCKLHEEYINSGFLSSLGTTFSKIMYRSLGDFEKGILLVAEHEGEVVGFISGAEKVGEFRKHFLKNNFFRLVFVLLPKVFNIAVIKKILETEKYSKNNLENPVPSAELLSMAVREGFQGKGVANQLFEKLCIEFQNKGINEFKIIAGNKLLKANRFYLKMGCVKVCEIEVHKGERSGVYTFKTQVSLPKDGRVSSGQENKRD